MIGTRIPTSAGWSIIPDPIPCDGRAISRAQYPALFALVGTTYGKGDGVDTFNVPDMRGTAR